MRKSVLTFSILAIVWSVAHANEPNRNNLSADDALKVSMSAIKSCKDKSFSCVITIVDADGKLKSQIVMDGGSSNNIKTSLEKAQAAALNKKWPHLLDDAKRALAEITMPFYASGITKLTGGAPIEIDNHVIGAIGISGALGQDRDGNSFDTMIVNDAIKAIQNN